MSTFAMYKGLWGDNIFWIQRPDAKGKGKVAGHMPRSIMPRSIMPGDEVTTKMKSGKIGRYKMTSVDRPGDPPDMFFATVKFVGYEAL